MINHKTIKRLEKHVEKENEVRHEVEEYIYRHIPYSNVEVKLYEDANLVSIKVKYYYQGIMQGVSMCCSIDKSEEYLRDTCKAIVKKILIDSI